MCAAFNMHATVNKIVLASLQVACFTPSYMCPAFEDHRNVILEIDIYKKYRIRTC